MGVVKFKVGDKVVVKPGFDGWSVSPDMKALEGRVVTITEVDNTSETYLVREDDGYNPWIDDFWERLASPKDIEEDNELEKQMKMESDAMIPWHEEDNLDQTADPLVTKILERNNKQNVADEIIKLKEQGKSWSEISDQVNKKTHDPIKPSHYNKGEIDLFESAYRTRPFNEFRAIMEFIAERYMKRDKHDRVEDIKKSIETLTRLKEYEEMEKNRRSVE